MNKQPQTCYITCHGKDCTAQLFLPLTHDQSVLNGMPRPVKELPDRYIFTKEELEAMKAEWQRESAEKGWDACWQRNVRPDAYPYSLNKVDFIDENYPLPQPPKYI